MLAAKGYRTELFLEGGRRVRPKGAMLHDESGEDWSNTSVLFMHFSRHGGSVDDTIAQKYFGYVPREGSLDLPPESTRNWDQLGEVWKIHYSRPGATPTSRTGFFDFRPTKNFKGDYTHEFKGGWGIFRTGLPILFKLGSIYRLEFPPWSEISWRGFVRP